MLRKLWLTQISLHSCVVFLLAGVGWSGYNWGKYVNGSSNGFWYHASHAHSMVSWGNSTTGPYGNQWTPRGECKPAGNCTSDLYGLTGPAWVESTTFTDDVHWVVSAPKCLPAVVVLCYYMRAFIIVAQILHFSQLFSGAILQIAPAQNDFQ